MSTSRGIHIPDSYIHTGLGDRVPLVGQGISVMEILPPPVVEDLTACREFFRSFLLGVGDEQNDLSRDLQQILELGDEPALFEPELARNMACHLASMEGKWFRAILAIISGRLCGAPRNSSISVAAALELIHLATLIHDDIIDNGNQRRGVPSLSFLCGPAASVLMGDLLHARAVRILTATRNQRVIERVAEAIHQVCMGEISQHQFTRLHPPNESNYIQIVGNKSGALISASADIGAILAEKGEPVVQSLRQFGFDLGIAFQISDDVLDVAVSSDLLGKDSGSDLKNGNMTLPLIHALGRGNESIERILRGEELAGRWGDLPGALAQTGSLDYAKRVARRFIERAKDNLYDLRNTAGLDISMLHPLEMLSDFVIERNY